MEVQYFSWLKNRVGTAREDIPLPIEITTPQQFIDWLCTQNGKYQALFSYLNIINVSVNGHLVEDLNSFVIKNDDKMSFFSPMAGG